MIFSRSISGFIFVFFSSLASGEGAIQSFKDAVRNGDFDRAEKKLELALASDDEADEAKLHYYFFWKAYGIVDEKRVMDGLRYLVASGNCTYVALAGYFLVKEQTFDFSKSLSRESVGLLVKSAESGSREAMDRLFQYYESRGEYKKAWYWNEIYATKVSPETIGDKISKVRREGLTDKLSDSDRRLVSDNSISFVECDDGKK